MLNQISSNIQSLLARGSLSVTELSRRTGVSQPVLHRVMSGNTSNPRVETLIPVARYFGITLGQLIGEEPLEINGARMGAVRAIPHVALASIHSWLKKKENQWVDYHLYQDNSMSESAFATTLIDTTMRPQFPEGTIVLLDPDQQAYDQDFVLVQTAEHELPVFRQLVMDGRQAYLRPMSQSFKTIPLADNAHILGCFVLARVTSRRNHDLSQDMASYEEAPEEVCS